MHHFCVSLFIHLIVHSFELLSHPSSTSHLSSSSHSLTTLIHSFTSITLSFTFITHHLHSPISSFTSLIPLIHHHIGWFTSTTFITTPHHPHQQPLITITSPHHPHQQPPITITSPHHPHQQPPITITSPPPRECGVRCECAASAHAVERHQQHVHTQHALGVNEGMCVREWKNVSEWDWGNDEMKMIEREREIEREGGNVWLSVIERVRVRKWGNKR